MKLFSLLSLSLAFSTLVYAQTDHELSDHTVQHESLHEINDYDTELQNLGRILADYQTVTTSMYTNPVTTTTANMYSPPVTTSMYMNPVTTTASNMYSNMYSSPVTTSNSYSSPVSSGNCPVNCPPVVKQELGYALKSLFRITDVSILFRKPFVFYNSLLFFSLFFGISFDQLIGLGSESDIFFIRSNFFFIHTLTNRCSLFVTIHLIL